MQFLCRQVYEQQTRTDGRTPSERDACALHHLPGSFLHSAPSVWVVLWLDIHTVLIHKAVQVSCLPEI